MNRQTSMFHADIKKSCRPRMARVPEIAWLARLFGPYPHDGVYAAKKPWTAYIFGGDPHDGGIPPKPTWVARAFGESGRLLAASVVILLLCIQPIFGANEDFSFQVLASKFPPIQEMAAIAERHGATMGIYGGTVRDPYLGHKFTIISDLDLIYDSSEACFPAFRDDILAYSRKMKGKIPTPDFHFDLSTLASPTARQLLYHTEGITITKIGVLRNDKILDPTGLGLTDLRAHRFRYFPPDRKHIELHNLGRFIRDLIRLPEFSRDPGSMELLKKSMNAYINPTTPEARDALVSARRCKDDLASGGLLLFHQIITPIRDDLRFQHNEQLERLSPYFPFDMFYGDLFRCVTQANQIEDVREAFSTVGVDRFLQSVGFEQEAKTFMNPQLKREDLFAAFQFPGNQPKQAEKSMNLLETWEQTIKRYNYRVLFDMLASEFPSTSAEAGFLHLRQSDFMATSTWRTLNPGNDYREMILGFLDADFNIKMLPREKVTKSFDWFLKTYLPFGTTTLEPFEPKPDNTHVMKAVYRSLRRGFSPEILAIRRDQPHSFIDLDAYLGVQTGPELKPLYLDPRTSFGFFMLKENEAALLLKDLGYDKIFRVNACGLQRRMHSLIGYQTHHHRIMLAQFGFSSDEQMLNQQARVYFLQRHLSSTMPTSIFTYRNPNADFPDQQELKTFLTTLKEPVSCFFAGFTNPLKKLLLNVRPVTIGDFSLMIGNIPNPDGTAGSLALCLSAFGANYGSLPARMVKLLEPFGLKTVVYIGTGGGISGIRKRFFWSIPKKAFLAGSQSTQDSTPLSFTNQALRLPLAKEAIQSNHATVQTPLAETRALVRELREKQVHSVDCELYHLAQILAFYDRPVQLYALINITDFPASDDLSTQQQGGEITAENSTDQFLAVQEALRQTVADLVRKQP